MRAQLGRAVSPLFGHEMVGAGRIEVPVAYAQIDMAAKRYGQARQALPGKAVGASIDLIAILRMFFKPGPGITGTTTDIQFQPAPMPQAEQRIAHRSIGLGATGQAIAIGGDHGARVAPEIAILFMQCGAVEKAFGFEPEMAEVIPDGRASLPSGAETVGIIQAAGRIDVGTFLFDPAPFDRDVGAGIVGKGRSGHRARRQRRSNKKLVHQIVHSFA